MKEIIYLLKDEIEALINKVFSIFCVLFPINKNKVVFINFNGKGYGCNPKYIAEEILNRQLDLELVWLLNDVTDEIPSQIRKVQYRSIKRIYEIATAKVIITNVKNDLFLHKKKGQYIIQTWHGSYSFKLIEKEAIDTLPKKYLKESKKNSYQTDLFLSNSKRLSKCYRDSFWCKCEILECGLPRNDVLFPDNKIFEISRIKRNLGLPTDCKLVLYAPTFRDDGSIDAYDLDCEKVLSSLKHTEDNWKLLIRLHPNVLNSELNIKYNDNVINVSAYSDMQELLLASDILLTDYSSTIFEFASMNKPCYIFATDIVEYQKIRGLNETFFSIPFPICENNRELLDELENYTEEKGRENAECFVQKYGGIDDGHASEKVVDRILQVIFNKL